MKFVREYDQYEAADILNGAHDILDETAGIEVRQPCRYDDDVLVKHQRLREQYQEPVRTTSPQRSADMDAKMQSDASWNAWADAKLNDGLTAYTREWHNTIGKTTMRTISKLQDQIDALRRQVTELRSQITQRAADTPNLTWHVDPAQYRLHIFVNGRAHPPMSLRPLFEAYHREAGH